MITQSSMREVMLSGDRKPYIEASGIIISIYKSIM